MFLAYLLDRTGETRDGAMLWAIGSTESEATAKLRKRYFDIFDGDEPYEETLAAWEDIVRGDHGDIFYFVEQED